MTAAPFTVRHATLSDVEGVAFVHVESWKTTYKGLLPDDLIAARTPQHRARQWQLMLSADNPTRRLFVAEQDGRIVGFANFGPARLDHMPFSHELYVIYGLAEVQRRGMGRALMRAGLTWLIEEQGAESLMLWVLENNAVGRGFYDRLGGEVVERRIDPDFSSAVYELAYGWNDLETLRRKLDF